MHAHAGGQLSLNVEMTFFAEFTEDMVALEVELSTGVEVRLSIW